MMYRILLFCLALYSCGSNEHAGHATDTKDSTAQVRKGDLSRIAWINGNWQGIYQNAPFYENYALVNDTLFIHSYEFKNNDVTKDTTKTSLSKVYWNNGHYYLGDSMNWKVTRITDREIYMQPNYKANNDITWTYQDSVTWVAVLKAGVNTNTYIMQRQPPLDSILKKR